MKLTSTWEEYSYQYANLAEKQFCSLPWQFWHKDLLVYACWELINYKKRGKQGAHTIICTTPLQLMENKHQLWIQQEVWGRINALWYYGIGPWALCHYYYSIRKTDILPKPVIHNQQHKSDITFSGANSLQAPVWITASITAWTLMYHPCPHFLMRPACV